MPDQTGPVAHLLVTCDKEGHVYVINRDKMGHYSSGANPDVQDWQATNTSFFSDFAFFQNRLYVAEGGGPAKAWSFDPSTGLFNITAQSQTSHTWGKSYGGGSAGSNLTISANGTQDAIVWAIDNSAAGSGPAVLYAYDASNLGTVLYTSAQAPNARDQAAVSVKFTSPTVANGRVYVPGRGAVTVYGLTGFAATPVLQPGTETFSTSSLSVSMSDSTTGATVRYTLDGSTPTSSSLIYSSPISITGTTTVKAIASAPGLANSGIASATYTYSQPQAATPTFNPGSETFSASPLSVSLADSTSGATIHYTLDGTTPTSSSPVYSSALSISGTTTVKAIATASNYAQSAVGSATYTYASPGVAGGAPVSDDFNESSLNTALWTVRAPVGGTASVSNGHLSINVPGGSNHDVVIPALDAVQVVQPVANADFDVAIKLDNTLTPSAQYSMQGILIYGNSSNYLRYEVYATGSNVALYAASIDSGTQNIKLNTSPFSGYKVPTYLRLKRSGTTYTGYWSADGTTWTQAISLTDSVAVTAMGPYGANYNSNPANAPALNTSVDWFHNLAATTTTTSGGISFSSGFSASNLAFNGSANLNTNRLRLTDGGGYESASAFYTAKQNVQTFTSSFSFQLTNAAADGFAFVIQNTGTTALGPYGAGLGYGGTSGGIPASVAVKFDLYNNAGEGTDSTGIYTNGALPTTPSIDLTNTGVNLHSGDTFNVTATYDGTTLTMKITDAVTNATATQAYTINIPSVVGSSTAYIGFTAGTGGASATQDVLNWTYTPQ